MYISIQSLVIAGSPLQPDVGGHHAFEGLGGLDDCRSSDFGGKLPGSISIIIRMESTTRMDAELVQRSNEIHERLKQLGDSL